MLMVVESDVGVVSCEFSAYLGSLKFSYSCDCEVLPKLRRIKPAPEQVNTSSHSHKQATIFVVVITGEHQQTSKLSNRETSATHRAVRRGRRKDVLALQSSGN